MENLWRVGFMPRALELITLLSGLVEILDVYWHVEDNALIFLVKSKSHELFRQDSLRGTPTKRVQLSNQPLYVDLTGLNETCQVQ